jgi:hypothetical protein
MWLGAAIGELQAALNEALHVCWELTLKNLKTRHNQ